MKKKELNYELINACYFGNKNKAIKLLREGADPNFIDPRDGWAGIHYSCRWGQLIVVKELILAGADPNLLTRDHETPLHIACSSNRINICIYLKMHGANSNIMNNLHQLPSDLTKDQQIKFICSNFEEYKKIVNKKINDSKQN